MCILALGCINNLGESNDKIEKVSDANFQKNICGSANLKTTEAVEF